MARWEYCRISWAGPAEAPEMLMGAVGAAGGQVSTVRDPGQQSAHTGRLEHLGSGASAERITRLDDTIARLGRAGWELVSHVQLHDEGAVQHWYFKRELTDITRTEF